jgi:hypothetical protein
VVSDWTRSPVARIVLVAARTASLSTVKAVMAVPFDRMPQR